MNNLYFMVALTGNETVMMTSIYSTKMKILMTPKTLMTSRMKNLLKKKMTMILKISIS